MAAAISKPVANIAEKTTGSNEYSSDGEDAQEMIANRQRRRTAPRKLVSSSDEDMR